MAEVSIAAFKDLDQSGGLTLADLLDLKAQIEETKGTTAIVGGTIHPSQIHLTFEWGSSRVYARHSWSDEPAEAAA